MRKIPAITVKQMREVDRAMIDDIGIELIQMMENAGRNLAQVTRERLGGSALGKRAVALAGTGGNGGGGLAAARHLANAGARVTVFLAYEPEKLTPVTTKQFEILRRMEVACEIFNPKAPEHLVSALTEAEIILDALIGYSLKGAPRYPYASMIRAANDSGREILALDIPSGLNGDTGEVYDPCIRATATMTLALPKTGLIGGSARTVVGDLLLADISVPALVYERMKLQIDTLFDRATIIAVPDDARNFMVSTNKEGGDG